MRSTEAISASDALFRGSDRHGFSKNRHGCFKKRSFQPMTGSLKPSRTLKMTGFSIVTAAFFRKNGQGSIRETVSGKKCTVPGPEGHHEILRRGNSISDGIGEVRRGNMK